MEAPQRFSLSGKRTIVIGVSRAIGRAIEVLVVADGGVRM